MSIFRSVDDSITNPGDLASAEVFGVLADNLNYMIDSMPVGSIVCIMEGFPGVPTPDLTIWQECDGSMITNQNSPIRNQPTPDYSDLGRYMRGYSFEGAGDVSDYGGSNFKVLTHSHGGSTGDYVPPAISQSGGDTINPKVHRHGISTDLNTPINFEPEYFTVKHFVKIR